MRKSEESEEHRPQTMFTQTNPEEVELEPTDESSSANDGMRTAASTGRSDDGMRTAVSEFPQPSALRDIAGLNPFSSDGSESECSAK